MGVADLDSVGGTVTETVADGVGAVPGGQDYAGHPLRPQRRDQPFEEGTACDRHHGLGEVPDDAGEPGPQAPA